MMKIMKAITWVPSAVAQADHSYAAIAPVATVQVAASVIVTAILTAFMYRRVQARRSVGTVEAQPEVERAVEA